MVCSFRSEVDRLRSPFYPKSRTRRLESQANVLPPGARSNRRQEAKEEVKDKSNHAVILDKGTSDKLYKDVQSYRLITVAVLVDRLKINGSLARKALNDLEEKGMIKKVVGHNRGSIYTRAAAGGD
ncbi:MAG: hypothetical protein Q9160_007967 [Pyrenula sp. 1 TL-2023]